MKILIATGIFPPDIGGPATYAAQFATACPHYGHTVTVVAYGNAKARSGEFPYTVFSVSRAYPPLVRHAVFFFACLRAGYSADVIFAQGTVSAGVPSACAAFILGKRFIVRVAGDFAWEYAMNHTITPYSINDFQHHTAPSLIVSCIRLIQRWVCALSNQIIVPSAYLKDIVAGWGVPVRKIKVIHNAVIGHDTPRAARNASSCLIFSAGRMVPWKGFASLIRVFAAIATDFPHARLTIAGDGPCREDLLNEVRACGVTNRVVFLRAVSPEKMAGLYAEASCFVLFSDYEGLSHVILEALAHKVPVIASNVLGNSEIISHGKNGMLVPRGDLRALKTTLTALLRNPEKEVPFLGFLLDRDFTYDGMMKKTITVMESSL